MVLHVLYYSPVEQRHKSSSFSVATHGSILYVHNDSTCKICCINIVKCTPNYIFQATDIKVTEVDFNPDFIKKMIPKLEWTVICDAADSVSCTV